MYKPPKNRLVFVALCVVCVLGAGAYLYQASQRFPVPAQPIVRETPRPLSPEVKPIPTSPKLATPAKHPVPLLFRSTAIDTHYGKLAILSLGAKEPARYFDQLPC